MIDMMGLSFTDPLDRIRFAQLTLMHLASPVAGKRASTNDLMLLASRFRSIFSAKWCFDGSCQTRSLHPCR